MLCNCYVLQSTRSYFITFIKISDLPKIKLAEMHSKPSHSWSRAQKLGHAYFLCVCCGGKGVCSIASAINFRFLISLLLSRRTIISVVSCFPVPGKVQEEVNSRHSRNQFSAVIWYREGQYRKFSLS